MSELPYAEAIELLSMSDSFFIATHSNPDGDTIGSALALWNYLSNAGKKDLFLYNEGKIPYYLEFLKGHENFSTGVPDREFDVAVLIDVGDLERVNEDLGKKLKFRHSLVIDHHLTVTGFGDIKLIDSDAAATGVILYRLMKKWKEEWISVDAAEAIYTAIFTDTGSFRFSNTDSESLHIAAELVRKGVDPSRVASNVYENYPFSKLHLLSAVLSTLTRDIKGRWAYIVVTRDMFARTGATPDMLEEVINYVRGIRGVEVAIQFREIEENVYKVGFRSKRVDVERIARKFGGGGHKNASGCKITGPYEKIVSDVVREVERSLQNG